MATVAETRHKAGRMLGIVAYGQALPANHDLLLTEAYTQIYNSLKAEGNAIWASTGAVPDGVMPHVAAMMALQVAPDIGVSSERYQIIRLAAQAAPTEIRRLTVLPFAADDLPVDY
jgi:hypothetical protein